MRAAPLLSTKAATSPRSMHPGPHTHKHRPSRRGRVLVLGCFALILGLFVYYNSLYAMGNSNTPPGGESAASAKLSARVELESTDGSVDDAGGSLTADTNPDADLAAATAAGSVAGSSLRGTPAATQSAEGKTPASGGAATASGSTATTDGSTTAARTEGATAAKQQASQPDKAGQGGAAAAGTQPETPGNTAKHEAIDDVDSTANPGDAGAAATAQPGAAGAGASIRPAADGKLGATTPVAKAGIGTAAKLPEPKLTAIEADPHAWDRSACAAGIDQHPASGKAAMLVRLPTMWKRRADPAWDEEAKREAERPHEMQRASQPAMPAARHPTAVLYVHWGSSDDQEANLGMFVKAGMQLDDNVQYRVILAGNQRQPRLPKLPSNARYVRAAQPPCNSSVWGVIGGVLGKLELQPFSFVVVASSRAMGPFIPPYARQHMHWTEVFTAKLTEDTKLVGSQISCEGVPRGGDASAEWRRNPYVLPHAWATDKAGWELLTADRSIFACYPDAWNTQFVSDAGASLAILSKGWNIDSLQPRYQGVDWRQQANWGCNCRMRPDRLLFDDGVNPSPYELVFLPFPEEVVERHVELRAGLKLRDWNTEGTLLPDNMYMGPGVWFWEWSPRVERSLHLNAVKGGPSCFDYEFYKKQYPELRALASSCLGPKCGFDLFQHYVILGQFQGRMHRFTCPPVSLTQQQRQLLALAQGRACFNHTAYIMRYNDLRQLTSPQATFVHWALKGQFEGRTAEWACADSSYGLAKGVDGTPGDELERERLALIAGFEEHGDGLLDLLLKEQNQQQAAGELGGITAAGAGVQQQQQADVGAAAAQQAAADVAAANAQPDPGSAGVGAAVEAGALPGTVQPQQADVAATMAQAEGSALQQAGSEAAAVGAAVQQAADANGAAAMQQAVAGALQGGESTGAGAQAAVQQAAGGSIDAAAAAQQHAAAGSMDAAAATQQAVAEALPSV